MKVVTERSVYARIAEDIRRALARDESVKYILVTNEEWNALRHHYYTTSCMELKSVDCAVRPVSYEIVELITPYHLRDRFAMRTRFASSAKIHGYPVFVVPPEFIPA